MRRWLLLAIVGGMWIRGIALAQGEEIPAGWRTIPLESFDRLPLSIIVPPEAARQRVFTRFQLEIFPAARVAGASARWELGTRPGITEAALGVPVAENLDGLTLWIKNPQGHSASLFCRLTDEAGRTWRTAEKPLGTARGWQRLLFRWDPEAEVGLPLEGPVRTIEIVLGGLQPGTTYTFYLDELVGLQAPLPPLSVEELSAPAEITAGASADILVGFAGQGGGRRRPPHLALLLEREGQPAARRSFALPPGERRLRLHFAIPKHIAEGIYQLRIECSEAQLSGVLRRELRVYGETAMPRVTIRPPREGGCFAVNGEAISWMGAWWRQPAATPPPQEAAWIMIPLTSDFDFCGRAAPVWLGPERFDYKEAERRLAEALGASPQAYLVPIVALSSPSWWDAQHPSELMSFGDGRTQLPASVPGAKRTFASWASSLWRQEAAAALRRFIEHLEHGPWGPAIIGYQLASGEEGCWAYPGASQGVFADYSRPQQEAFRAWLKNKYKDLATLRAAWGQPAAPVTSKEALQEFRPILGWNDVRVPPPSRRLQAASVALHDPTAAQDVVDYQIFCSDLVLETIRYFAQQVKEATTGKKAVGVAYGHLFALALSRWGLQNSGHLALAPLCAAPEIDFVVSAGASESNPNLPLPGLPVASLAAHGKAWLAQGETAQAAATLACAAAYGGMAALEARPSVGWDKRLRALPPAMPRAGMAEIAVIADDISAAYIAGGTGLAKALFADQSVALAMLGAPFDLWTLDDVLSGLTIGYRLYIFLDAFYLDAQARQKLIQKLGEEKATALWIYAPGAIDWTIGGRTSKELTGLTVAPRNDKGPLQVRLSGSSGYLYGLSLALAPRFVCVDDQADIRGTLVGSPYGGLAMTEHPRGFRSVWTAAPSMPAALLRNIAQEADVHLFCDKGAGVYANRNLLFVRAAAEGEQELRLPRVATLYDLATGNAVGVAANRFSLPMKGGEIHAYYWGEASWATP